jgi:hypothetical protein
MENQFAARWQKGQNPFESITDLEISVLPEHLNTVRQTFDDMAMDAKTDELSPASIERHLGSAKVLRIAKGQSLTWKDILEKHIPNDLEEVHIYDRFIRNRFQFKSLEMLLDFLYGASGKNGMSVRVTTTAETEFETAVRDRFRRIQQRFSKNKPHYEIKETTAELPHYRLIGIKSKEGDYSIWLDKGVHIYWFDHIDRFRTVDTYIVIEKNAVRSMP